MTTLNYNFLQGNKYLWLLQQENTELKNEIINKLSFPDIVAQILISKGFSNLEDVKNFLYVEKEKNVAEGHFLKDADKAVTRILAAIEKQEKILIFGDYDVDGITSCSLLLLALNKLNANINFYLPNRVKDGYGLSKKIVKKAAENNYKLIITVDNGITAFEPAELANSLGIDLIITDHHLPHSVTPAAFAIVNPQQKDCVYPFKFFAGVGVIFKLVELLYSKKNLELPDKVIELMLLGTVADVVPLLGENRYWVRKGIAQLNRGYSYSISVLKKNSNFTKNEFSSTDIGFLITPQINALGRLDDPRAGVKFLLGAEFEIVDAVGELLLKLNNSRKEIELNIFNEIEILIKKKEIDLTKENIILAGSKNWQAGVIGLVASRLVGKYGRPVLLFHFTADGIAKGSCRAIPEFNIFEALVESKHLIDTFGGHAAAAGLALKIENLKELKINLENKIKQTCSAFDLKQKLRIDAHSNLSDFNIKLLNYIKHLEPFGHKNSEPIFYIKNLILVQRPVLLKKLHIKCMVFSDGVIKSIMFFNRPDLFDILIAQGDSKFDCAVQILQNHWNGITRIELQGIDIANYKEL